MSAQREDGPPFCGACKEDLMFVDTGECKILRPRRASHCRHYEPLRGVSKSPICQSIGTDERDAKAAFPQAFGPSPDSRPSPAPEPPDAFTEARYDEMMTVQDQIRIELERSGFDPCPSIKIAQEATAKAWDIWTRYQNEYDRLKAEQPKPSPVSAQELRTDADKVGFLAQLTYTREYSGELMAIRERMRSLADWMEGKDGQ